mmetsp:Transcript_35114/g.107996  ORF Transcript_35114/g.107996 Transcript_35114/m.107996 type:complete len:184 (+) Transcript_35114:118-669(+)
MAAENAACCGPEAAGFWGDGSYPGDGGPALERLWRALRWREIRNCPGRYTTPDAFARSETPGALLARCGLDTEGLAPCEVRCEGKDPILLQRLVGGGGLLTYCRPGGLFVHTLNTESGLARKLEALGLPAEGCFLGQECSWAVKAALCSCVAVLPFLLDREKNASAYAMIVALRRTARGCGSG